MPDNEIKFPSDIWIPEIKTLCFDVLKNLQKHPGGEFLRFQDYIGFIEKPGKIVREYHRTAQILKIEVFQEDADQSHIDYHKIAALYIRSFLKYRPFQFNAPKPIKTSLLTELANEYFSIPFLETIFRAWNDDFEGQLRLDQKYRDDYIKLLYRYKNNITKLDPLSFSNTIYLIEQKYFLLSKSKKS